MAMSVRTIENEGEINWIMCCEKGQEGKPAGGKKPWAGNPRKTQFVAKNNKRASFAGGTKRAATIIYKNNRGSRDGVVGAEPPVPIEPP